MSRYRQSREQRQSKARIYSLACLLFGMITVCLVVAVAVLADMGRAGEALWVTGFGVISTYLCIASCIIAGDYANRR